MHLYVMMVSSNQPMARSASRARFRRKTKIEKIDWIDDKLNK